MKEYPVPFTGAMVRAFQQGHKTQTRRILKIGRNAVMGCTSPKVHLYDWNRATVRTNLLKAMLSSGKCLEPCLHVPFCHKDDGWCDNPDDDTWVRVYPRWQKGDRLWIKEAWGVTCQCDDTDCNEGKIIAYRASEPWHVANKEFNGLRLCQSGALMQPNHFCWPPDKWKPSIFMPRWASRYDLDVVETSIERLHDISEEDAIAEGVIVGGPIIDTDRAIEVGQSFWVGDKWFSTATDAYAALWNSINGPGAWDRNDWVVKTVFKLADREVAKNNGAFQA